MRMGEIEEEQRKCIFTLPGHVSTFSFFLPEISHREHHCQHEQKKNTFGAQIIDSVIRFLGIVICEIKIFSPWSFDPDLL